MEVFPIKRFIIITLIISLVTGGAVVTYKNLFKEEPIDIVNKFVDAINEHDFDTVFSCFEPKYEKVFKLSSSFTNNRYGIGLDEAFDVMYEFITDGNYNQITAVITEVQNIVITDNYSEVDVNIEIIKASDDAEDDFMETFLKEGENTFYLKKFKEGWRITDIAN